MHLQMKKRVMVVLEMTAPGRQFTYPVLHLALK